MRIRFVYYFITLLCLFSATDAVAVYDGNAAAKYAKDWYDTDINPVDHYVDHVNWPKHSLYLEDGTSYNKGTNDNKLWAPGTSDCSNFGSQCLIAGGVDLGLPHHVFDLDLLRQIAGHFGLKVLLTDNIGSDYVIAMSKQEIT